jgi:hypothetical protein
MKKLIKIAFLSMVLLTTSCGSHKKTVTPEQPTSFDWLTANLDIQAEGNGMSFNDLSGQLRMRKDSLVWLNVTATMGVEALRIKVSEDSVWIVNRLEKSYLTEPLDTLAAQLSMPLSLSLIQNLLLDNNESFPPVEHQTVQLKTFVMGDWSAKIKYKNVKLNEMTTFPLKITDKMERFRLQKK